MYLIVGLGNPGDKYKKTRHNAGFILLDEIARDWEYDKYSDAYLSHGADNLFVKPQTFMNNSGISVKNLLSKHSIKADDVIVIHDDIDLPFGAFKISFERGDGGHNGIKSIVDQIGTNKFIRLRIGIAPMDGEGRAIKPTGGLFTSAKNAVPNFVLKDFSSSDLEKIKSLKEKVEESIEIIVGQGTPMVMNKFN